jgi:hypothetical protein
MAWLRTTWKWCGNGMSWKGMEMEWHSMAWRGMEMHENGVEMAWDLIAWKGKGWHGKEIHTISRKGMAMAWKWHGIARNGNGMACHGMA